VHGGPKDGALVVEDVHLKPNQLLLSSLRSCDLLMLMRNLLLPLVVFLLLAMPAYSQTCSQANVQAAINAAADGATVSIPAGNCTWSTPVSWANKNISLIGAGIGVTNITAGSAFSITADTKAGFRISGMTLIYSDSSATLIQIQNNTATPRSGWRVDHILINQTGSQGTGTGFIVLGMCWGLIDHLAWNNNGHSVQAINSYAYANGADTAANVGGIAWTQALDPGGPTAVYVEDSTFNFESPGNPQIATGDSQMGGRMVWRHNVIHGAMTMTHAAWDATRGQQKFEFYNNTIDSVNGTRPFLLRSGFNVVFNNTITGSWSLGNQISIDNVRDDPSHTCQGSSNSVCNGSSSYDKNTPGQTGWPCEDQIGVGQGAWQNQTLQPSYFWNNGSTSTQINCTSPHLVVGRDYFDNGTAMPGYTPYTYPHPLQGAKTQGSVAPPAGLSAQVR
jgi:hypothetical protein